MSNLCIINITGVKEGYDKTLYLFSYKGSKQSFFV